MKTARYDLILKYIIEDFIQTGVPVGSKNLLSKHRLDMSSATIRNYMADLERDGLIEKPHTSAGRVPSAAGYQYYLEHIFNKESSEKRNRDGDKVRQQLASLMSYGTKSMEKTIENACEVLSQVTSLATVVLGSASSERLVSVTMVPISSETATVILVTDSGNVESKLFTVPPTGSMKAVAYGIKLLNDRLIGTKIGDVDAKVRSMEPILKSQIGRDFKIVMEAFCDACVGFSGRKSKSFGGTKLMELPEFTEEAGFRKFVQKLLNQKLESGDGQGIVAKINPHTDVEIDPVNDISIVKRRVSIPGGPEGDIAVVGPNRMDYHRILDLIDMMLELLSVRIRDEQKGGGS